MPIFFKKIPSQASPLLVGLVSSPLPSTYLDRLTPFLKGGIPPKKAAWVLVIFSGFWKHHSTYRRLFNDDERRVEEL